MIYAIMFGILLCSVVIIVLTIRQSRTAPTSHPTKGFQPTIKSEVDLSMSNQRTQTAILRAGVSALIDCQYRILVVDDDIQTRLSYRAHFKNEGKYVFLFAASAGEALKMLGNVKFDLAIIDMFLSDMSGMELFDKFELVSASTPYFVVSAGISEDMLKHFVALNVPVFSKPIDFIRLRHEIDRAVFTRECS